jgi:hypothetical protein
VSLQHIRGSEDPDAALFRQMEQYVLDHYPNPNRTGCPDSQTLRLLVSKPLLLEFRDANFYTLWNVQSACVKSLHTVMPGWPKQARQLLRSRLYQVHQLGLRCLHRHPH